jgi:hypothetical protein
MPYRHRAHTAAGDIRSKLHGFAGEPATPPYSCLLEMAPQNPDLAELTILLRVARRGDLLHVYAVGRAPHPPTPPAAMHLPGTASAPSPRRPACPRGSEPPAAPAHPRCSGRRRRGRVGRGPDAGGRAYGDRAQLGPARPKPRAAEALTLPAAALADILSLSSAARGSSHPKLLATGPPAPHATAQINISRERAGQGRRRPERPGPRGGRGFNSDKSLREAPAPPAWVFSAGRARPAPPSECSAL